MWKWIKDLDRVLRGDATRFDILRQAEFHVPAGGLAVVILLLAVLYGMCMGFYAWFRPDGPMPRQALIVALKVPALFYLTLLVTFPSLYVFNTLVGSRLRLATVLRLLVAALSVNLAVLSSLGPIVAFFSVCTTGYTFIVLLNVAAFAFSGFLGMWFLLQTLNRITLAQLSAERPPPTPPMPPADPPGENQPMALPPDVPYTPGWAQAQLAEEPGALDRPSGHVLSKHVKAVFACWVVLFGLVGAQMSWVLRPFIGSSGAEIPLFRPRGSNFFEAVLQAIRAIFP
jgi:hypothetical protein